MSTEVDVCSRLGAPEQVAQAAVVAYRRRSFLGRHPVAAWMLFAVSPVVSLVVLFVLACLGVMILGTISMRLGFAFQDRPSQLGMVGASALCYAISLLTIVIPSAVLSILYCKLADRLGMGNKWIFVSCAALAVMAATPSFWFSGNQWTFCLFVPRSIGQSVAQLVQLAIPAVVCCRFMRRHRDAGELHGGRVRHCPS